MKEQRSRQQSLTKHAPGEFKAATVPLGVQLKETSEERVLRNHDVYTAQWDQLTDQREKRYEMFISGMQQFVESAHKPWMDGMVGLQRDRSILVKKTTGDFCGSAQKRSVIADSNDYVQSRASREAIARQRRLNQDKGMIPTRTWYDSLRARAQSTCSMVADTDTLLSRQAFK